MEVVTVRSDDRQHWFEEIVEATIKKILSWEIENLCPEENFGINCWITPEPSIVSRLQKMSGHNIKHVVSILRNRKNRLNRRLLEGLAKKENVKGRLGTIFKKFDELYS